MKKTKLKFFKLIASIKYYLCNFVYTISCLLVKMKYLHNILTVLISAILIINTAGLHVYSHYCSKGNSNSISIYSATNGCSHCDEDDNCCNNPDVCHSNIDESLSVVSSCCSDNNSNSESKTKDLIIAFDNIDCCIDSFQYFTLESPFIDKKETTNITINVRQLTYVLPNIDNNRYTDKIPSHLLGIKPVDFSARTCYYHLLYYSQEEKTEDHLS